MITEWEIKRAINQAIDDVPYANYGLTPGFLQLRSSPERDKSGNNNWCVPFWLPVQGLVQLGVDLLVQIDERADSVESVRERVVGMIEARLPEWRRLIYRSVEGG